MWFGSWSSHEAKPAAPECNSRRRVDAETEGTIAGSGLQDVTFGSNMVASLGRPNWSAPAFKVLTDCERERTPLAGQPTTGAASTRTLIYIARRRTT